MVNPVPYDSDMLSEAQSLPEKRQEKLMVVLVSGIYATFRTRHIASSWNTGTTGSWRIRVPA